MQNASFYCVIVIAKLNQLVVRKHKVLLLKVGIAICLQVLCGWWWCGRYSNLRWRRLNADAVQIVAHIVQLQRLLVQWTLLLGPDQKPLHLDALVVFNGLLLLKVVFFENERVILDVFLLFEYVAEDV